MAIIILQQVENFIRYIDKYLFIQFKMETYKYLQHLNPFDTCGHIIWDLHRCDLHQYDTLMSSTTVSTATSEPLPNAGMGCLRTGSIEQIRKIRRRPPQES